MNPIIIVLIIASYFGVILLVSKYTSKGGSNNSFFLADKKSKWYVVAFGMLGASLSGVTFISVPGWVASTQFSYLQMVLGYVVGYVVIAFVLLPVYYKLNLTSIYTYLQKRFGIYSQKTGAWFFFISRIVGASFRLFIVATVLQVVVCEPLHIPFFVTVVVTVLLIWVYTNKGGLQTIIWTDVLQTAFMFIAAILTIVFIYRQIGSDNIIDLIVNSKYSKVFFFDDINSPNYFFKQFFAGMFITIVMTGLDQDMMQKNLSCPSLKDAQKNMLSYGIAFIPVNIMFLSLGALLYIYAAKIGLTIPARGDEIFSMVVQSGTLPAIVSVFFVLGLVAAAYSSADSALTALTTTFTVDILGFNNNKISTSKAVNARKYSHIGISFLLILVIVVFHYISDESVISAIFKVAGYTYGPLLGLFAFGLFTKLIPNQKWIPVVSIVSPVICYLLQYYSKIIYEYSFGFELLIVNGLLVFIGLYISVFFNKTILEK